MRQMQIKTTVGLRCSHIRAAILTALKKKRKQEGKTERRERGRKGVKERREGKEEKGREEKQKEGEDDCVVQT